MHSLLLVESVFCNNLPRIGRYDITQDLPHTQIYLIIFLIHLINVIFYDRAEKMVSSKYLGEVACTILLKLTRLGAICGGQLPKVLNEDWIFTTGSVCEIVEGYVD